LILALWFFTPYDIKKFKKKQNNNDSNNNNNNVYTQRQNQSSQTLIEQMNTGEIA